MCAWVMDGKQIGRRLFLLLFILLLHIKAIVGIPFYTPLIFGFFLLFVVLLVYWEACQLVVVFFLVYSSAFYLPDMVNNLPALPLLIPFGLSVLVILPFKVTRETLLWMRWGRMDRFTLLLTCVTGLVSVVSLIVWALWTDNLGIGVEMVQGFVVYPKWMVLILGIPLFALVNAFAEEVLYRGLVQEAARRTFVNRILVLVLQASAFAALHFAVGFPNGSVGYGMTLVYGMMLGYLRERSGGLLAPYVTHVVADLVIGYVLYGYAS